MAGGCETFNVQLEVDSFTSLENQLSSRNSTWTKARVRHEALVIFNSEMYPKQVGSYFAEKRGDTEMPVDQEYEVVDGKLVHSHYSFEKMIEHAATPEEKASLKLLQETLVKAAVGTQVVAYDLSALNQSGIRYADLWSKKTDGKVKIEKRVDVARGGSPLGLTEAWLQLGHFAKEETSRQIITNGVPQVGIVVVTPDKKNTANPPHEPFLLETKRNVDNNRLQEGPLNQPSDKIMAPEITKALEVATVAKVVTDTKDSLVGVYKWLRRTKRPKQEQKQGTPERRKSVSLGEIKDRLFQRLQAKRPRLAGWMKRPSQSEAAQPRKTETPHFSAERTSLGKKLEGKEGKVVEKGRFLPKKEVVFQRTETPLVTRLLAQKRRQAERIKTTVILAAETGVGVGAALWGLKLMSEKPRLRLEPGQKKIRKKERIVKSSPKKEITKVRPKEKSVASMVTERPKKREQKKRLKTESPVPQKDKRKDEAPRANARGIFSAASAERNPPKPKTLRLHPRTERPWFSAKADKRQEKTMEKRSVKVEMAKGIRPKKWKETRRPARREEKEAIASFALVYLWWLLLRPRDNLTMRTIKPPKSEASRVLIAVEPSPWVLLAIIWYLAQIREQGMVQVKAGRPKNSQKKPRTLPPQGIIFAAHS